MHATLYQPEALLNNAHSYILTDCEWGNPVSALGVGGTVPLVAVDLGWQPKPVYCSPHFKEAVRGLVMLKAMSLLFFLFFHFGIICFTFAYSFYVVCNTNTLICDNK